MSHFSGKNGYNSYSPYSRMIRLQRILNHCVSPNSSRITVQCATDTQDDGQKSHYIHFWRGPKVDEKDDDHKETRFLHNLIQQNHNFSTEIERDRNVLLKDIDGYRSVDGYSTEDVMAIFVLWIETTFKYSPSFITWPNAMCLSTIDRDQCPSARFVLLKSIELHCGQFIFFTNYESRKGLHISVHNKVALTFYWQHLDLSVRIRGTAHRVSEALSDRYWSTRPKASKLSAITSDQSQPINSKLDLNVKYKRNEERMNGIDSAQIPRPEKWGGFAVDAHHIEFWNGHQYRFHDRTVFTKQENGDKWTVTRLQP